MPRQSPEARREYYLENRERIRAAARERYQRNREQILRETKEVADRNRDFRKAILAQFPCLLCGESDPDMIDWHHVYEEDKLFNIAHTSRKHDEWWDEVLKCIPVCVSCHRKIHKEKLCLISPIGFKPL